MIRQYLALFAGTKMAENTHADYYRGTVDTYDDRAGYGYIHPDEGAIGTDRLLVHRRSLRDPTDLLRKDDRVLFRIETVPRGLLATDVHLEPQTSLEPLELTETFRGEIA